jgi:hypothetical protein
MDQREAVRVPVRLAARCRFTSGAPDVLIVGKIEDMSRSGLFLATPWEIALGTGATIELDLPEGTLSLTAEVVRIERGPRTGVALRFLGDPERARRPLANFIMRSHAIG